MASFATQVQIRRGTDAENDAFTGAEGEVTMDLTNKQLRVHDGQTKGGMKIPNIKTVFGTSQIQDGAITEPKLSADLQTKINEKTSGAGRNIGDIFWTTRTDSALNGAVECNGAQYNFADVNGGANNVQELLDSGALPSVTIVGFDAKVASDGGCDSFGYDSGATYFKVPKKTPRILVRCQKPTADNDYTWYNLYADGWVEQGGKITLNGVISNNNKNIALPVTMASSKYYSIVSQDANAGGTPRVLVGWQSTISITVGFVSTGGINGQVSWEVKGYADSIEYRKDKWDYQNVQVERPMVQLFNGATDEAVAKCTEVLADVAGLKQATDGMIDYVVESQEPTEANGYTWYRLYKSGWVEQGGYKDAIRLNTDYTIVYPIEMGGFNYTLTTGFGMLDVDIYTQQHAVERYATRSTTGIALKNARFAGNSGSAQGISWQVSGMSAQGA